MIVLRIGENAVARLFFNCCNPPDNSERFAFVSLFFFARFLKPSTRAFRSLLNNAYRLRIPRPYFSNFPIPPPRALFPCLIPPANFRIPGNPLVNFLSNAPNAPDAVFITGPTPFITALIALNALEPIYAALDAT